jgi:hypothetical protein
MFAKLEKFVMDKQEIRNEMQMHGLFPSINKFLLENVQTNWTMDALGFA